MTFGDDPAPAKGKAPGMSRRRGRLWMALCIIIGAILAVAIFVGYVLLLGIGPA